MNVGDTVVCTYTNTYVKTTPTAATTLKNASGDATVADGAHLPLGSGVYDTASIGNAGGFPLTGTVTFKFFNTHRLHRRRRRPHAGVAVGANSPVAPQPRGRQLLLQRAVHRRRRHRPQRLRRQLVRAVRDRQGAARRSTTTIHNGDHGDDRERRASCRSARSCTTPRPSTGAVAGFAIPAVTFTFFNGSDCANADLGANTGADEGARPPSARPPGPLGAGNYSFNATVGRTAQLHRRTSSDCEPFIVDKAQLAVDHHDPRRRARRDRQRTRTSPLGTIVHDTATVTGGVAGFPIPAVTFTFFTRRLHRHRPRSRTPARTEGGVDRRPRSRPARSARATTRSRPPSPANDNYIGRRAPTASRSSSTRRSSRSTTTIHNSDHSAIANNAHVPLGSDVARHRDRRPEPSPASRSRPSPSRSTRQPTAAAPPLASRTRGSDEARDASVATGRARRGQLRRSTPRSPANANYIGARAPTASRSSSTRRS